MKDFRQLQVWTKSHEMAKELYQVTTAFPREEMFGITSQIRRAGTSIPTNIAEGCGRGSDADFKRFIQYSFGSASEVEYLLFLSFELNYIKEEKYRRLNEEIVSIKKMLAKLMIALKK